MKILNNKINRTIIAILACGSSQRTAQLELGSISESNGRLCTCLTFGGMAVVGGLVVIDASANSNSEQFLVGEVLMTPVVSVILLGGFGAVSSCIREWAARARTNTEQDPFATIEESIALLEDDAQDESDIGRLNQQLPVVGSGSYQETWIQPDPEMEPEP
jgi:hypothetical protein